MKNLKIFFSIFSKFDLWCCFASIIVAIASCWLLFYVPTITICQIVIIVLGALLVLLFNIIFFNNLGIGLDPVSVLALSVSLLISVIFWLLPISLFWSLIPTAMGIFSFLLIIDDDTKWMSTAMLLFVFAVMYIFVNDKIVLTNYMATNPKPKEVVISNVDITREIMFIEDRDNAYKLSYCDYKTLKALNLKKGDTVKIITHPNLTESVIEISK